MCKLADGHQPGADFQKLMAYLEGQPLFQGLVKMHHEFEAQTKAKEAMPGYKKFSSEYDRKFPQIEELLDAEPISDEAKKHHDFLMSKLWPSGNKGRTNTIIGYVNRNDFKGASDQLNIVWEGAKKLNMAQAAAVHTPDTMHLLQQAGADTVNQVKEKGEQVIRYIGDLKRVQADLQQAETLGEKLMEHLCVAEFLAIKDTIGDCRTAFTLINSAEVAGTAGATSGVGPALAALMITSVVAGIGLEIAACILGILRCLETSLTGKAPPGTDVVAQVEGFRKVAEGIQKVTEPIVTHLKEIEKYGNYIRKVLHRH